MHSAVSSASCVHDYVLSYSCSHILSFHDHAVSMAQLPVTALGSPKIHSHVSACTACRLLDKAEAFSPIAILTFAACAGVQVDQQ